MPKAKRNQSVHDRSNGGRYGFEVDTFGKGQQFLHVVADGAAGAGMVAAQSGDAITPAMKAVAPGFMVMATIYFMGTVSGAHLNPAVILAFAVR
jgi:glycerol uptake facilitator-like aquaporin